MRHKPGQNSAWKQCMTSRLTFYSFFIHIHMKSLTVWNLKWTEVVIVMGHYLHTRLSLKHTTSGHSNASKSTNHHCVIWMQHMVFATRWTVSLRPPHSRGWIGYHFGCLPLFQLCFWFAVLNDLVPLKSRSTCFAGQGVNDRTLPFSTEAGRWRWGVIKGKGGQVEMFSVLLVLQARGAFHL